MPFFSTDDAVSVFETRTIKTDHFEPPGVDDTFDIDDLPGRDLGMGRADDDLGGMRPQGAGSGGRGPRGGRTVTLETTTRERRDFPVNPDFQLQIGETKEGRMIYVMRKDFYYCHAQTQRVFRVRRHFETDLASVPKPVWALVNPSGQYAPAAIIHDWLYAIGEPGQREDADRVMLDAMADLGVPVDQRDLIYTAIRAGGAKGYGLAGDWAFSDPDLNGKRYQDIPRKLPTKPMTAVCFNGVCGTFTPPAAQPNSPYE